MGNKSIATAKIILSIRHEIRRLCEFNGYAIVKLIHSSPERKKKSLHQKPRFGKKTAAIPLME